MLFFFMYVLRVSRYLQNQILIFCKFYFFLLEDFSILCVVFLITNTKSIGHFVLNLLQNVSETRWNCNFVFHFDFVLPQEFYSM